MEISRNTQGIKPSSIRKMFNKALQYDDVISFTLGEPGFYSFRKCRRSRMPGHPAGIYKIFRECRAASA